MNALGPSPSWNYFDATRIHIKEEEVNASLNLKEFTIQIPVEVEKEENASQVITFNNPQVSEQEIASIFPIDYEVDITPPTSQMLEVIFEHCGLKTNEIKLDKVTAWKIGTFCLVLFGVYPNYAVARTFGVAYGGNNEALLGLACFIANIFHRVNLGTWSYHKVIESVIGEQSKIKYLIRNRSHTHPLKVALHILFVTLISILDQVPRAYVSFSNNGNSIKNPNSILSALLTVCSTEAVTEYSTYDATVSLIETKKTLTAFEKQLDKLRIAFLSRTKSFHERFGFASAEDRERIVTPLKPSPGLTKVQYANKFYATVLKEFELPPLTRWERIKTAAARSLGLVSTCATSAAQLWYYLWIAQVAAKRIEGDPGFYFAIGSIVAICNSHLAVKVMNKVCNKKTDQAFFNPLQIVMGSGLASKLRPKTRALAEKTMLTICILTSGTTILPVDQNMTGLMKQIEEIGAPIGIGLLGLNALTDSVNAIFNAFILRSKNSTEQEKLSIMMNNAIENFAFTLEKMDVEHFAILLDGMSDRVFKDLVKNGITKVQLKQYLKELEEQSKLAKALQAIAQ